MAVVNVHGQSAPDQRELTLRSAWFSGRSPLTSPKFWLTGIAFLALYLAFNKLTERKMDAGWAFLAPFASGTGRAGRPDLCAA
ncbi:MAG: hypothetical protein WBW81_09600, partial [Methylocella sp.]